MPSLWFVVPVHGRLPLAAICLRQLKRTCDALAVDYGIDATAVVITDGASIRDLYKQTFGLFGFATVERDNQYLSRKFNDGIQLACDPQFNPRPADYVVPIGSDDWVDPRIFHDLPPDHTVVGFQTLAFVREDGHEIVARQLTYEGGSGIRIYPAKLMELLDYRPADEDRPRGCDTSILVNLRKAFRNMRVRHDHHHDFQIVDWKTQGEQLNPSDELGKFKVLQKGNPFQLLQGIYPDQALAEMRRHYTRAAMRLVAA